MKARIKKIEIMPLEEWFRDLREMAQALDQGRRPKKKKSEMYFESLDAVRNVLTDRRLELWRTIRDRKPKSISEAAQMVGRGFRAVHRDLKYLEEYELITFKKRKGKRGDVQTPVSLVDELQVKVA